MNGALENAVLTGPILCYIDEPWAYFTTQALDKQWGDDWDDAPYEHNAGEPYGPPRPDLPPQERAKLFPDAWNPDGTPRWRIVTVAFEGGDFVTPSWDGPNSSWSVKRINRGQVAWLRPAPWAKHDISVFAGTPLFRFVAAVQRAGGRVFVDIATLPEGVLGTLLRSEAQGDGPVGAVCANCGAPNAAIAGGELDPDEAFCSVECYEQLRELGCPQEHGGDYRPKPARRGEGGGE